MKKSKPSPDVWQPYRLYKAGEEAIVGGKIYCYIGNDMRLEGRSPISPVHSKFWKNTFETVAERRMSQLTTKQLNNIALTYQGS